MSQINVFNSGTALADVETLTGNTGGAVGPNGSGNITVVGSGTITVTGNAGANSLTISSTATTPTPVAEGGTGNTTFTAYSVIAAGTTATGVFQNVSGVGTAGQLLTSNGAGSLPTWQAAPSTSISITGDTGGALSGTSFTFTGGSTGLSFGGSGSTQTLTFAGITANGGTVSLATDATTSTVNVGTGAGAKTVTLGSTTGASVTAIKYGTADYTLASATGTVMSALDTGEITYPLQPAFGAYLSASTSNDKTGDGTAYTVIFDTELFDQNADYNNTTGVFTAPVTGKYLITASVHFNNVVAQADTYISIVTTAKTYIFNYVNAAAIKASTIFGSTESALVTMTSGDTCSIQVNSALSTKTVGILGAANAYTAFQGYLVC